MRETTLALAVLLLVAGGCASTHQHTFLGLNIESEPGDLRASPDLPDAYGTLAIRVGMSEETPADGEAREFLDEYPFPLEEVARSLKESLQSTGAFQKVVIARDEDLQGAHLLLDITLEDPYLAHVRRDTDSTWALVVWLVCGWATHWWHDQVFELHYGARAKLTDLHRNRPVGVEALPDVASVEALSFHERTDNLGVYLLTLIWPPGLSPVDPETVTENMIGASRLDMGRPLADLLGRLHQEDVCRISLPEGKDLPVTFLFESPRDGELGMAKMPLKVRLEIDGTLKDLETVRVGEKVLWDLSTRQSVPPEKSILFEQKEIVLKDGKASLEVKLRSREKPVMARIEVRPEVRLRKEVPGG